MKLVSKKKAYRILEIVVLKGNIYMVCSVNRIDDAWVHKTINLSKMINYENISNIIYYDKKRNGIFVNLIYLISDMSNEDNKSRNNGSGIKDPTAYYTIKNNDDYLKLYHKILNLYFY